jgi:three-Cys-motif partner protein
MVDNQFFDESREQSQIKARIVAKYFWAWAKVVIPSTKKRGNRIAYIDLFAGPGRYEDGTLSTPLLVLKKAIEDPDMREMLVTLFNDRDAGNVGKLRSAIDALPGIETLKHKPQVSNDVVGEEIAKMFAAINLVPTFFFVDPWGYKGLSLRLINSVLQNWGCDCVFFFNYNRVNMGLNNQAVREHMDALFGKERADLLRARLLGLNPDEREMLIVEELSQALKQMGAGFVLPFTFKDERSDRTKHHLIFATKHFKGYEIMKGIMAKESSERIQGVPTFEYSPAIETFPMLFELSRPLDDLAAMLLNDFAGQRLRMRDIYLRHSVGKPYIESNYKRVLASLEAGGKVMADPPAEKRRKMKGEVTFADDVLVSFPKGGLL